MHPQVVRTTYEPNGDVPDCPICGMPLTIRAQGQKEELPAGGHHVPWSAPASSFRPSGSKWQASRPWRSIIGP